MNERSRVPFLDLVTPHRDLRSELGQVFNAALDSAGFIGGPMVDSFEREFAEFCGVSHCVGVGSGTDALRFALMAAGVKDRDAVITVPNSFIATTEAISQAGGRPIFVDIDERTYNMDPRRLVAYLQGDCYVDGSDGGLVDRRSGTRVVAVVPVHLYGQPADMNAILEIAERFNLMVIEDACQAHGAECLLASEGTHKRAGSMGVAAAFSFYPGKNLGACGEAGAITTNDANLAKRMRILRDHGQLQKYYHETEGYNGRLDALQAGILSVKLKRLAEWNEQRRSAAARYRELLTPVAEIILPEEPSWAHSVYHLFVARVKNRDGLIKDLASRNIGAAIHYPVPLHLQQAYAHLGYKAGDFPATEAAAAEIVSLPIYPQLTAEQQMRTVEAIRSILQDTRVLCAS